MADSDNKPANEADTKTLQKIRDKHYLENGVDEQGNAPADVEFDSDGKARKTA